LLICFVSFVKREFDLSPAGISSPVHRLQGEHLFTGSLSANRLLHRSCELPSPLFDKISLLLKVSSLFLLILLFSLFFERSEILIEVNAQVNQWKLREWHQINTSHVLFIIAVLTKHFLKNKQAAHKHN
jgi:hypothetical protein